MQIEGVSSYYHAHFWEQSSDYKVGSLHIQVSPALSDPAEIYRIKDMVTALFKDYLDLREFTLQIDKQA